MFGLDPVTFNQGLMEEATNIAKHYAEGCDRDKIPCILA